MLNEKPAFTKEMRKEWAAALRSGEYKQARYRLYDDRTNGYCCLGVCADLFYDGYWEYNERDKVYEINENSYNLSDEEGMLLNIPSKIDAKLSSLNDNGLTFEEIADLIENDEWWKNNS